jgi:hypothetical protein
VIVVLYPVLELLGVEDLLEYYPHFQEIAVDEDEIVDAVALQELREFGPKPIPIELLIIILKLRYNLQTIGDLPRRHLEHLLIELHNNQALINQIQPPKFLGNQAFKIR